MWLVTLAETPQHWELSWILGRYPRMGFAREPAPLTTVAAQVQKAGSMLCGQGVLPSVLPPCNLAWDNLYRRTGVMAYLAVAAGTSESLRPSLRGMLAMWADSIFCHEARSFRHQFGLLHGPLVTDEQSQWVAETPGTRFLVKVLAARPGGTREASDMFVTVLSRQTGDGFSELPEFQPESTLLGVEARLQRTDALRELLARAEKDGVPGWDAAIGEELARRADLPVGAAALLWAGCTETTNALRFVVSPETRKLFKLQVKHVNEASDVLGFLLNRTRKPDMPWWYNITGEPMPTQALYDVYQEATPDAPDALWQPLEGGEDSVVARLARAVGRIRATSPNF